MRTATKLDLSIKETPQSVSVITQQLIEDKKIEDLRDVINNTTGLSSSIMDSQRSSFYARGFSISNYQIDGVSTTIRSGYDTGESEQGLTMYDRVEIVRGATGLINGAGNPSAAINMVRKHANSKEFKGNISLEGGSWDKYKGSLDIQTPLDEKGNVRARIAASYEDKKSFMDFYENKKSVLYGVIDADITESTRVSLGASYQKNDPKGSSWGGLPYKFSDGTLTNWDRSKSTASDWTYWSSENKNYFANIEHYFDNDIRLFGSYSRTDSTADYNLLYLYGNLNKDTGIGLNGMGYNGHGSTKQDNIDIYASIPFELGNLEHEIVTGLTYNNSDVKSHAVYSYPSIGNFYNYNGISEPIFGTPSLVYDLTDKQLGAYLVGKISLTDDLKFILGSRITNFERDFKSSKLEMEEKNVITPYAGLVYDINDIYSVYASYTDIFKINEARDKNGNFLDPIEGKAYETGIKGSFFEDKLNAGLAIFRIEQDNVATNDPSGAKVPGSTSTAKIPIKGTISKGFDIDISGEITENWHLGIGYSQFKAYDINKKDVLMESPRKIFKVFSKYSWNKLSIGAGVNWQGQTKNGNIYQEAYLIANAMVNYKINKDLSIQLNMDNLFDKKYYSVWDSQTINYGEPRSFNLSMKYSF